MANRRVSSVFLILKSAIPRNEEVLKVFMFVMSFLVFIISFIRLTPKFGGGCGCELSMTSMLFKRLSVFFCIMVGVWWSETYSADSWISMVDRVNEELAKFSIVVFIVWKSYFVWVGWGVFVWFMLVVLSFCICIKSTSGRMSMLRFGYRRVVRLFGVRLDTCCMLRW